MVEEFSFPILLLEMDKRGLLCGSSYLWLYDMEWLSVSDILDYEYDDGETHNIVPFAKTGGGDKWVFVRSNKNMVGICEGCEITGKYYAKNLEDAIIRHILEYVSDSNFYVKKEEKESYQISETELSELLDMWVRTFTGIIDDRYIDLLNKLNGMKLKKIEDKFGEWYALLSLEECDAIIKEYLYFDQIDTDFEWYLVP